MPSPAERFIQLHYGQGVLQLKLRQIQLRLKQIAIGIESIELRVDAAVVAQVGQALAIFQIAHQGLLLFAAFARALVRDQRVGHFRERRLNGFLDTAIRASSCSACGNLTLDLRRPAVNIGCVTCGTKLQTLCGPLKRLDNCVLWPPRDPLRLSFGKVSGARHTDLRVGGNQHSAPPPGYRDGAPAMLKAGPQVPPEGSPVP